MRPRGLDPARRLDCPRAGAARLLGDARRADHFTHEQVVTLTAFGAPTVATNLVLRQRLGLSGGRQPPGLSPGETR